MTPDFFNFLGKVAMLFIAAFLPLFLALGIASLAPNHFYLIGEILFYVVNGVAIGLLGVKMLDDI
jgi:hypothetical protein